jgi:hypothetical protein
MTEQAKTELEIAREKLEAEATAENAKRSGKGTRVKVGSTRGKNPQPISFENFDEEQPDTLPKTLSEFMEITKVSDENVIVSYLVDGFNAQMYTAASDPIAEFVNPAWDEDTRKGFRIVVRNYAQNAKVSIEDAVALIKPGIEAAMAAKANAPAGV